MLPSTPALPAKGIQTPLLCPGLPTQVAVQRPGTLDAWAGLPSRPQRSPCQLSVLLTPLLPILPVCRSLCPASKHGGPLPCSPLLSEWDMRFGGGGRGSCEKRVRVETTGGESQGPSEVCAE